MPSLKSFPGWAFALIGSILLNVGLFGLMPGLIHQNPNIPKGLENITQVQVVQIKRPPPKKPERPRESKPGKSKPDKPESRKKVSGANSNSFKQRTMDIKPQLAFQLNSELPKTSMNLVMPGIEAIKAPILKTQYTMGELDSPLTPLVKLPPIYPILATRRGIEGYVTVEFLINKKGLVQQLRILEAKPEHIFNKSVTACVSQWKFKPGTVEGIPVATRAQTTIRFKLEK
ncbi:MAG: energy transducer TonB [Desulfobacteraceae bacterium]|nr:energy transducer TonB [Desulfobacteraceae bacterium]